MEEQGRIKQLMGTEHSVQPGRDLLGLRSQTIATNNVEPTLKEQGRLRRNATAGLERTWIAPATLLIHLIALLLALIAGSECHFFVSRTITNAPLLPSLIYGVVLWYWWGIAAWIVWRLTERDEGVPLFATHFVLGQMALALVFAGAQPFLLQSTVGHLVAQWPVMRAAGYNSLEFLNWNRFFFGLLLYGFIFGIASVVRMQGNSQRGAMRMLSLQKELSVAHLRALQMQIEPHFLFNTLNAISGLVESSRRDEALQTLEHLNRILRSTLKREASSMVRLADEVELVDNYLAIEELRFSDRMQVQMTIDPTTLDARVPSFLLQPIVENAIRHGIAPAENGGLIQLKTWRSNESLHLLIKNSAPSQPPRILNTGHGIGLRNTKERLQHLYGGEGQLQAFVPAGGGFEVHINFPYEVSAS